MNGAFPYTVHRLTADGVESVRNADIDGGAWDDAVPAVTDIPEHVDAAEREQKDAVLEGDRNSAATAPSLIQTSAQFIAGFKPPDYLIDGILQRGFIYSLTGKTGGGKTAVTMLIATSVARGQPIGSHDVCQSSVLYFAGENPDDIRMRWIGMADNLNFDIDDVAVHFIPGTFKISELYKRIEAEAEKVGPFALVIVDTSAAYFEGDDENSNAQAGAHARRLSGFAVGQVERIKTRCLDDKRKYKIRVIHEPETDNPAHAALRQWPRDNDDLLDLIAADEWNEIVLNKDVP